MVQVYCPECTETHELGSELAEAADISEEDNVVCSECSTSEGSVKETILNNILDDE